MESAQELIAKLKQIEQEDLEHLRAELTLLLDKYDATIKIETVIRDDALPTHRWYLTKRR